MRNITLKGLRTLEKEVRSRNDVFTQIIENYLDLSHAIDVLDFELNKNTRKSDNRFFIIT